MTCPHRRVREHGRPHLVHGPPLPYRVAHSGVCMDCGWPVIRFSPDVEFGDWETVAGGTPPLRIRRYGQRYGTGREDAA